MTGCLTCAERHEYEVLTPSDPTPANAPTPFVPYFRKKLSKHYNNRVLAIPIAFTISLILLFVFLYLDTFTQVGFPSDAMYFLYGANGVLTVSQIVSAIDYFAQLLDLIFNKRTLLDFPWFYGINFTWEGFKEVLCELKKRVTTGRFIGTLLGTLFAIGINVTLIVLGVPAGFYTLGTFADVLLFFRNISSFAGLSNRVAKFIDYIRAKGQRLPLEAKNDPLNERARPPEVNYMRSLYGGLLIGLTLSIVIIAVVGLTSGMTAGGLLPVWLGVMLFFMTTTSSCVSSATYFGRAADILLGPRTLLDYLTNRTPSDEKIPSLTERLHSWEARFTLLGLVLGIVLAGILIGLGFFTLPIFSSGLPLVFSGILVMAICTGGLGGLGNRLGLSIDTLTGRNQPKEETTEANSIELRQMGEGEEEEGMNLEDTEERSLLPASYEAKESPPPSELSSPGNSCFTFFSCRSSALSPSTPVPTYCF